MFGYGGREEEEVSGWAPGVSIFEQTAILIADQEYIQKEK